MIAVTQAREACKGKKDLKKRLVAAMKAVSDHWLVTDENERLRAAICAVCAESNEDDAKIVMDEWNALLLLADILAGRARAENVKIPEKRIGIMDMWNKVKGK
jgi:hypothetical protein